VVAEVVEDPNTLASLTELGCEFAQGYFLGRPRQADLIGADFRQNSLV
jgi:EAL domain-containing protein (putative c-di-GMP-specific phosphodiesterase class I)